MSSPCRVLPAVIPQCNKRQPKNIPFCTAPIFFGTCVFFSLNRAVARLTDTTAAAAAAALALSPPFHPRQSIRRPTRLRGRGEAAARVTARLVDGRDGVPDHQYSKRQRQHPMVITAIPAANAAAPRVSFFPTRIAVTSDSVIVDRGDDDAKLGGGSYERAVNVGPHPSNPPRSDRVVVPIGYLHWGRRGRQL